MTTVLQYAQPKQKKLHYSLHLRRQTLRHKMKTIVNRRIWVAKKYQTSTETKFKDLQLSQKKFHVQVLLLPRRVSLSNNKLSWSMKTKLTTMTAYLIKAYRRNLSSSYIIAQSSNKQHLLVKQKLKDSASITTRRRLASLTECHLFSFTNAQKKENSKRLICRRLQTCH